MTTELEEALKSALRSRAAEVPHVPMPRLDRAPRPARRGWLVPVAAAVAAAAGIAAAVVALTPDDQEGPPPPAASFVPRPDPETLRPGEVYYLRSVRGNGGKPGFVQGEVWQSPQRTGPWRDHWVSGGSVENGRVVPDGLDPEENSGTCYPFEAAGTVACKQRPSWTTYPSLEFLAAAPRDPAALGRQLHAAAVADAQSLVDDGLLSPADALGERNVAIREMSIVQVVLAANGVSSDLRAALHEVVAALPGVEVTENMTDRIGRNGTGYHFGDTADDEGVLIFDGDTYLGSPDEAFVYGIAPGLGKAPSRLLG